MQLNSSQFETVSKYLSDISKILVASTVVGFFVPIGSASVDVPTFVVGSAIALIALLASVLLASNIQNNE